ncbi:MULTISPECIES: hypothetical protein [Paraburkholderia]|uniref:Uncharacterized protein n=1 Tax=Paraburkholderia tagetis TaxID=2913261 RepID=A0A9X1UN18_9BURK|nr:MULTISPECIES: hypothetical protein [Paraburkholderia]MCG5078435.1 hypothetical protein [Paraburkholderia tagetis]RAR54613.1 hypothetical protein C7401_124110 [Paraburkholderia unamae]CAG9275207.1 conserved membrane hypothetical protein [Paraburkholderia unamae]
MELHMHSHHFVRRMPEWPAAIIGGCVAGAVFLVIELFAMGVARQSVWSPLRMIAAIVMGRDVLAQPATFAAGVVIVALLTHFVLAILFAVILAVIMAPFSLDSSVGTASLVGAIFGVLLYVINFHGMTQWFSWFADARGWVSFLNHIVFGLVAANTYLSLERKEPDASGKGNKSE